VEAAYIVPPPRRRASPSHKTIGGVCSLRFTTLRSGRKPVLPRLKGGGAAPVPWPGAERKEKTQTSVFAFFPVQGGFLPPPPPHRHIGAHYARPAFRLPITLSAISPTADASNRPPQNSVTKHLPPITARPLKRTGGHPPGEKLPANPLAAKLPSP
jgi:hypothetical protein